MKQRETLKVLSETLKTVKNSIGYFSMLTNSYILGFPVMYSTRKTVFINEIIANSIDVYLKNTKYKAASVPHSLTSW